MSDHISSERDGGLLIVTFNRPDKKNAITFAMYERLVGAMAEAERDPAIRALLFEAAGDTFTAGNDLNDFLAARDKDFGDIPTGRFLHALNDATKPLIAGVDGPAVGIGTTMLLHCDLVYASPQARFQLPFVDLGLVPEAGSSLLLPRLIGLPRAAELLLRGAAFSAEDADRAGLLSRLLPREGFREAVRGHARAVAAKAPEAIRLTKRLVKSSHDEIDARIREEVRLFAERLASPELKEAIAAFFEKRAPDYSKLA